MTRDRRNAARVLAGLLSGAIFGVGLALSGMTQPAKVQGFLDVTGHWDPSLAFVMGGALAVSAATWWLWARRRSAPILDQRFAVPPAGRVDARLLAGSAIFGVGWGLGGFCPGPAIASLGAGVRDAILFCAAMAVGMLAARLVREEGAPADEASDAPTAASR